MHRQVIDRAVARGGEILGTRSGLRVEDRRDVANPDARFLIAELDDRVAGRNRRDDRVHGVADSNPAAEFEETRDKAKALLRALELAQQGL